MIAGGPPPATGLPEGLLIACYGDDFTGSTAVMEVLSEAGLPTVFFLEVPPPEVLGRYGGLRALVVAGTARARPPEWMEQELPPVFRGLDRLGPQLLHYKVCSTLDSSPRIGSIGRAIEIGLRHRPAPVVPVLVAAPPLRRYQVFGTLFAAGPGGVFRLDRHPVMAIHPVTPMDEAHVATHLGRQTALPCGTLDREALLAAEAADGAWQAAARDGVRVLCLDCLDSADSAAAGRLIWASRGAGGFCVGSQGIEYALVAHWRAAGMLAAAAAPPPLRPAGRIAVVSGSLSPVTRAQIGWAASHGFEAIPLEAAAILSGDSAEEARVTAAACAALAAGRDPLVHSVGDGPAAQAGPEANQRIGSALGRILDGILAATGLRRAVIAGGDTSGIAGATLGVRALTYLAPAAPGSPLCRAEAPGRRADGMELVLKGGQMGGPDFFGRVRDGA